MTGGDAPPADPSPGGLRQVAVRTARPGARGAGETTRWALAVEAPCEIRIGGAPFATLMSTPEDLDDLAVGFVLTEGVVATAGDVLSVRTQPVDAGVVVAVEIAGQPGADEAARNRVGFGGCGICGVATIAEALGRIEPVAARPAVTAEAVAAAFEALAAHQPLNRQTRSVHAAAAADDFGRIHLAREDVGRHNALDKLVGALARGGRLPWDGFVAMTSRASVELVQKASVAGASTLATLSAPTTLAVSAARSAGMKLATRGPGGVIVFVD